MCCTKGLILLRWGRGKRRARHKGCRARGVEAREGQAAEGRRRGSREKAGHGAGWAIAGQGQSVIRQREGRGETGGGQEVGREEEALTRREGVGGFLPDPGHTLPLAQCLVLCLRGVDFFMATST